MKLFFCSLFVLSLAFFESLYGGVCDQAHHLFCIERSKNRNIVQYDVCSMEDGNLAGKEPVVVYWILENGEKRELNAVQRELAYGIESQKRLDKHRCEIVLTAFQERKITVKRTEDGYRAFAMIDAQVAILEKIYIESRERWARLPEVLFIDLFGRHGQTNVPIRERIFRK